jgi:cell wall-associated NlpC family hydrolase
MSEQDERDAIDRIAREYCGTPFVDQGEVKGPNGGVDCAKLIKLVYRDAGLVPDFRVENYSPQFFLHQKAERFLGWVEKYAHEIPIEQVKYGDIVLYKVGHVWAHGAIVIKPGLPHIIHAWYASRMVRRANYLDGDLGKPKRQPRFFSRW